jgi:NADPH:quinone reductase-like Zn-dependent oxidoreductase
MIIMVIIIRKARLFAEDPLPLVVQSKKGELSMKAVRVNGWGQPLLLEDIPQPQPAQDEVLVRVHAASINPFDSFVHMGYMGNYMTTPLTLGTDFAGEVVEVGEDIRHLKPGDAVYGLVPMHSGSFAEYLVAKAHEVTHKPKTLSYVQAAGVPLSSLAAYQSLFDLGQAQKGERVLIIGASGAAGSSALQMAKEHGMQVYAVSDPERASFVRELSPDCYIDAQSERYEDEAGAVDLVLDFKGGEHMQRSFNLLQPGGRYVTALFLDQSQEEAERRGIRVAALGTQARVDHLDDMASRIDSNRLKTFLSRTFPLEDIQAAMAYWQNRNQPGKVVLKIV